MNRPPLPILNYHGLQSRGNPYDWLEIEKPYVMERSVFLMQLKQLNALGFSSLSCEQLPIWFAGAAEISKPVMLTFDDGHISHYEEAVSCLEAHKMGAVFFIPAGLVGGKDQMNWLQLRELLQAGFEIGSHGLNHIPLTGLSDAAVFQELDESKKKLEDKLGIAIQSLSIPRGFYQERIRRMAQHAGYQWVFTSDFDVNLQNTDPLALKRMVVRKTTSPEQFLRIIEGRLGTERVVEKIKTGIRTIVPSRVYDRLADAKRLWMSLDRRNS